MDIPNVFKVVDFTPLEKCLSLAADVAVGMAAVEDPLSADLKDAHDLFLEELAALGASARVVEDYWDSLSQPDTHDVRWRDSLLGLASSIPDSRRAVVMVDLCLESSTVDFDDLTQGVGARRLNAVLDLLNLPFCAADVQSTYVGLAENLATLKANWVHEVGFFGAGFVGGAAGGYFGLPLGSATQKGVGFLADQVQGVDPFSLSVAHLLSCALAVDDSDVGVRDFSAISQEIRALAVRASRDFARHRQLSANLYTGDAAQADRHRRVLNGAVRILDEVHPDQAEGLVLEDVVGMPLSAARSLLESEGLVVETRSGDRMVLNEHNWVVTSQDGSIGGSVKAGTVVYLDVTKYGGW